MAYIFNSIYTKYFLIVLIIDKLMKYGFYLDILNKNRGLCV